MARHKFPYVMIVALASWLVTAQAWAHRDRGPNDPCRVQLGASLLHVTLYQPQFDPNAEYCEEVPRTGKTVLVVDVTPGELRQTPIGIEVVAAGSARVSQAAILSIPPKIYERGVADTEVFLNAGSSYLVRVTVATDPTKEPQMLAFPLQVTAWYKSMVMPALMVVGVLVLVIISVIRYQVVSRQQASSYSRQSSYTPSS